MNIGDTIKLGKYPQSNSYEREVIEWKVINKKSNLLLVISKYVLDAKPYNNKYDTDMTWEHCSLRKWLNNDFFDKAFKPLEKRAIISSTLKNPDNNRVMRLFGPSISLGGNDTNDKIFLLSIDEAEQFFNSDLERKAQATNYARDNNVYAPGEDGGWWWLRSPGNTNAMAAVVFKGGKVYPMGDHIEDETFAVRPAMWIDEYKLC